MTTYKVFIRDEVSDLLTRQVKRRHVVADGLPSANDSISFDPHEKEEFNENGPFKSDKDMSYILNSLEQNVVWHSFSLTESQLRSGMYLIEPKGVTVRVEYSNTQSMMINPDGKKVIEYGLNEKQQRLFGSFVEKAYNERLKSKKSLEEMAESVSLAK